MIAAPDAHELTVEERVARMAQRRYGQDIQDLFFAQDAAEVARSMDFQKWGYCSPLDWIKKETKMTAGDAADRICVGEQLEAISDSADAVIAGEIGFAHLVVIARTAEALRGSPTSRGFDEHRLLERARGEESLTTFGTFCLKYCHVMDPQAYVKEELDCVEERSLEISGGERGMAYVKGWLDSAGAAALRSALEPLARKSGKADERKRERRVADALVDLAMRTLDSGSLPMRDGHRPHLQVMAPLDTLMGLAGAPAADLEFSLPISAKQVERIACDCSITRILLGSDSTVIDVGRARRTVHPTLLKALKARDQRCVWPGCDRAASFTNAHHLVHWTWRPDRPRQLRPALLSPPPPGSRGRLADGEDRRSTHPRDSAARVQRGERARPGLRPPSC
jgi:hypothetical protein